MTFTHDQLSSPATKAAFTEGFNAKKGARCPYSKLGDTRYLAQAYLHGKAHAGTRQGRELGSEHGFELFLSLESYTADGCHGTDVAKIAAGVTRMADLP